MSRPRLASTPHSARLGVASLTAVALAMALAGCGDVGHAAIPVAAKVNADEIPLHQLDSLVAQRPGVSADQLEKARRETLELLVDQELAAQMALKKRLDRTPDVINSLNAARREILARSYQASLVAELPPPTDAQVRQYYAAHPLLFARRRVYALREIAMPVKDAPVVALEKVAQTAPMEKIEAWLRGQQMIYTSTASARPAEQILPAVLDALDGLRPGQTAVVETGQGVFVVRLVAARAEPLDQIAAAPQIRRLLAGQNAREVVTRDLRQLKDRARIEYANEFVGSGNYGQATVVARAETQAPAGFYPGARSRR